MKCKLKVKKHDSYLQFAAVTPTLRGKPCQVTWERRRQADIGHAGKLHEQPFQADSEAAMGGHAVTERLQVRLERLYGQVGLL